MALNPFFQQGTSAEQNLIQSLINEQLKIYGVEVYYIPRKYINTNNIIREVLQSDFKDAYPLEAYVQNFDGFDGNQDLMSKFGVRVTDELTLVISKERYESYIQPVLEGLYNASESEYKLYTRPKEGDLIWFPLSDTIFQIKYVEHEKPFYQLKENYVYELRCEIFEYDNEVIDTGIADIDDNAADDGYILSLNLAGLGSTATAVTTLVTGAVNKLTLIDSGLGYTSTPPIVAITSAPSGGIDATAVAITTQLSGGDYAIDELRIINPGAGYTQAPVVRFISNTGSGAIATAGISTLGSIGIVTVTSGGTNYTNPPKVTITGPSVGTTATAVAKIASNRVTQLQITNAGSGYTSTPTISFSSPTGPGALATATVSAAGTVTSVTVTDGGDYYVQATPPTVTFSAPADRTDGVTSLNPSSPLPQGVNFTAGTVSASNGSGSGLTIAITVSESGAVTSATIADPGQNYSQGDIVNIDNGLGGSISFAVVSVGDIDGVQATGTASVSSSGIVTAINITNAGVGYYSAPTITINEPIGISTGAGYTFNEVITGTRSSTTARVKSWDPDTNTLKVGMISGDFIIGEAISGAGATYALKSTGSQVSGAAQEFDTSASYDQNVSIESEAINIIDFTEKNPFGSF